MIEYWCKAYVLLERTIVKHGHIWISEELFHPVRKQRSFRMWTTPIEKQNIGSSYVTGYGDYLTAQIVRNFSIARQIDIDS